MIADLHIVFTFDSFSLYSVTQLRVKRVQTCRKLPKCSENVTRCRRKKTLSVLSATHAACSEGWMNRASSVYVVTPNPIMLHFYIPKFSERRQ